MLTGRDIVCISSVDWDFHWQIHENPFVYSPLFLTFPCSCSLSGS